MVAIVVAVGATRSWRARESAPPAVSSVLAVRSPALGAALQGLSVETLRWWWAPPARVRLAVVSQGHPDRLSSRLGTGIGDEDVDDDCRRTGLDRRVHLVQGRLARGARSGRDRGRLRRRGGRNRLRRSSGPPCPWSSYGALGVATYRYVAAIPRRALQLFVGAMLVTFGTFWAGEGLNVEWPGGDFALVWLGALYVAAALLLMRIVSDWRRDVAAAGRARWRLRRERHDGRAGDGPKRSSCSSWTTSSGTTGRSPPYRPRPARHVAAGGGRGRRLVAPAAGRARRKRPEPPRAVRNGG